MRAKLQNSKQLLLRFNRKRRVEQVSEATQGINTDLRAVEMATTVEQIRGYEGSGAARYFPAMGRLIQAEGFELRKRTRRPPTDPINALLSFGYTLLYNHVLSFIFVEGLTPYIGNLHRSERKETHLAFDLMEAFRSPVVDSMVLRLVNQGIIRPDDFEPSSKDGGIYLADSARRLFLQHFEARISGMTAYLGQVEPATYRRAIQLQVRDYKRSLMGEAPYQPFLRAV